MKTWPSITIPNPIDTEFWKNENKNLARIKLCIPKDEVVLAFGSSNALQEYNKGFDLLSEALKKIKLENKIKIRLLIFGEKKNKNFSFYFPSEFCGYLNDEKLKTMYSAVDAVIIPSRQEAFGQIACEASACETPVIAFETSGLRDIIKHRHSGYLAKKYNTDDLADGIKWILQNKQIKSFGKNGRNHIKQNFEKKLIGNKYLEIYKKISESR